MIDVHTYSKIKNLCDNTNLSYTKIADKLSLDPRTVAKWAKRDRYERLKGKSNQSCLDPYKLALCAEIQLTQCSTKAIFNSLKKQGYEGGCTIVKDFITQLKVYSRQNEVFLPSMWMLTLLQGKRTAIDLLNGDALKLSLSDAEILVSHICNGNLRKRNRAIIILANLNNIPATSIAKFLMIDNRTVYKTIQNFSNNGLTSITSFREGIEKKYNNEEYKNAVFSVLHSPPKAYNINRTSWTMKDLHFKMKESGMKISKDNIRKIINDAGYKFRKAKKVLTSTDPEYREKLKAITKLLSNLKPYEKFFSIDEYGPFAIKMQGGKSLVAPGKEKTFPQWQKSKGSLIITGALELSTNQMTHFYSSKKNTDEMIKLLYILLKKYQNEKRIYFSWDAASWHASKKLQKRVDEINSIKFKKKAASPIVKLAPLPTCGQFLNVIESVFSGMARAIIHNSDYESVTECKAAIDKYFEGRNENFRKHPKRAGNKIWGKERVKPMFSESNNCKDPMYR